MTKDELRELEDALRSRLSMRAGNTMRLKVLRLITEFSDMQDAIRALENLTERTIYDEEANLSLYLHKVDSILKKLAEG